MATQRAGGGPCCLWTQPEQRLGGGPGLVEAGAAGDDLGLDFSPQGEGILVLLMRAGRKRTEESLVRLVVGATGIHSADKTYSQFGWTLEPSREHRVAEGTGRGEREGFSGHKVQWDPLLCRNAH